MTAITVTSAPTATPSPAPTVAQESEETVKPILHQPKFYEVPMALKRAGVPGPGSVIRFKNDATIRVHQPGHIVERDDVDDGMRDPGYYTIIAGTSATITRLVSNTDNKTIFVTIEILTQDAAGAVVNGWFPIVESSKFKEWDWMVSPMQMKMVRQNFENSFDIVIPA